MRLKGILSSRMTSGHGRTSETVRTFSLLWFLITFTPLVSFGSFACCYWNHTASDHVIHLTYYRQLQEILVDEPLIQDAFQDTTWFVLRGIFGSIAVFLMPSVRKQSLANVNVSGLTLKQREIRNLQLNPGAIVSSLVALYLILH